MKILSLTRKKSDSFEKIMLTIKKNKPGSSEFKSSVKKVKDYLKMHDISRITRIGHQVDC